MALDLMARTAHDGNKDDTAAIEAAYATGEFVDWGSGNYRYNGRGIDRQSLFCRGDVGRAIVQLGKDSYLFRPSQQMNGMNIAGLITQGGRGFFAGTWTGPNVQNEQFTIRDFAVRKQSGTAISHLASDWPNWRVLEGHIDAGTRVGSIGVALNGLTDNCVIDTVAFGAYQTAVKLGHGGNNASLRNLDLTMGSKRLADGKSMGVDICAIHVVPVTEADGTPSWNNTGTGLDITQCKFGNEWSPDDTMAHDKVIVYADDDTSRGTSFADRLPALYKPSNGRISGHMIHHNGVMGGGAGGRPFIYSTTPWITGCEWMPNAVAGTYPSHLLKFLDTLNPVPGRNNGLNRGSFIFPSKDQLDRFVPCNKDGMLTFEDALKLRG